LDAQEWAVADTLIRLHNANVNANRSSPLFKVAVAGRVELIQAMIDRKVKVNAKAGLVSAVMQARLPQGQTERVLKMLLANGMDLSVEESLEIKERFPRAIISGSKSAPAKMVLPRKVSAKMMTFSLQ
jgi:hypothetical protein